MLAILVVVGVLQVGVHYLLAALTVMLALMM
jgi:hypothetical protein